MVQNQESLASRLRYPVQPGVDAHGLADVVVLQQCHQREPGRKHHFGREAHQSGREFAVREGDVVVLVTQICDEVPGGAPANGRRDALSFAAVEVSGAEIHLSPHRPREGGAKLKLRRVERIVARRDDHSLIASPPHHKGPSQHFPGRAQPGVSAQLFVRVEFEGPQREHLCLQSALDQVNSFGGDTPVPRAYRRIPKSVDVTEVGRVVPYAGSIDETKRGIEVLLDGLASQTAQEPGSVGSPNPEPVCVVVHVDAIGLRILIPGIRFEHPATG